MLWGQVLILGLLTKAAQASPALQEDFVFKEIVTFSHVKAISVPILDQDLDQHTNLEVTTVLIGDEDGKGLGLDGDSVVVDASLMYHDQVEHWSLSGQDANHSVILCNVIGIDNQNEDSIILTLKTKKDHSATRVSIIILRKDIRIRLGDKNDLMIRPKHPATFMVFHRSRPDYDRQDRFVVRVQSNDNDTDVCMAVSVHSQNACPFKNREDNFKTANMWATGLSKITFTIRADKFCFKDNFVISVLVLSNDLECRRKSNPANECSNRDPYLDQIRRRNESQMMPLWRPKVVSLRVDKAPTWKNAIVPILVLILAISGIGVIGFLCIHLRDYRAMKQSGEEIIQLNDLNANAGTGTGSDSDIEDKWDKSEPAYGVYEKVLIGLQGIQGSRRKKVLTATNRLKMNPSVEQNAQLVKDTWFRRNRSKIYSYIVWCVLGYYFNPAIQFAYQAKNEEEKTGSQDICYHNFQCQRPWLWFSDFNHIISSCSYCLFGLIFIGIVKLKQWRLDKIGHATHQDSKGVPQQFGMHLTMGGVLFSQGAFSVCYHTCPNNLGLQFDTTSMYMICILFYIKIYQNRHPDAMVNAFAMFVFLAVITYMESLMLYLKDEFIKLGLFVSVHVVMTVGVVIDYYYVGVLRADPIIRKAVFQDLKEFKSGAHWINYKSRFACSVIVLAINLAVDALVIVYEIKTESKSNNYSHAILLILVVNLLVYFIFYLLWKWHHMLCSRSSPRSDPRIRLPLTNVNFRIRYSSDTILYIVIIAILGTLAGLNYVKKSANRDLTPAESRELNQDCSVLDFYDNHDLWHFFSSAGVFVAFLAMLTVDDDILFVPRNQISA